jgi:hypothetical protein
MEPDSSMRTTTSAVIAAPCAAPLITNAPTEKMRTEMLLIGSFILRMVYEAEGKNPFVLNARDVFDRNSSR